MATLTNQESVAVEMDSVGRTVANAIVLAGDDVAARGEILRELTATLAMALQAMSEGKFAPLEQLLEVTTDSLVKVTLERHFRRAMSPAPAIKGGSH